MNRTLNIKKNHSTQFYFDSGHFYEGATFSMRGREKSSSPGESISHFAEIESPGGGNICAGGRLYKGAILFLVTCRHAMMELVLVKCVTKQPREKEAGQRLLQG